MFDESVVYYKSLPGEAPSSSNIRQKLIDAAKDGSARDFKGLLKLDKDLAICDQLRGPLNEILASDCKTEHSPFFTGQMSGRINQGRAEIRAQLDRAYAVRTMEKERKERIFNALRHVEGNVLSLRCLQISGGDLQDIKKTLAANRQITIIDLFKNELGDSAVEKLIEFLEGNTAVMELKLEENPVSQGVLEQRERLSPNRRLKKLLESYRRQGDDVVGLIRLLSQARADFTRIECDGWRLIHFVSYHGHEECAKFLLAGVPGIVTQTTSEGENKIALHLAAAQGHKDVLAELLKYNLREQLEAKDTEGHTALSLTIQHGNSECALQLLRAGANPNHDVNKKSVLSLAIEQELSPLIFPLLKKGAWLTPEMLFDREDASEIAAKLREWRQKELSLCECAKQGKVDQVEHLIAEGVRIDCVGDDNKTPLYYAMQSKYLELCAFLINKDAHFDGVDVKLLLTSDERWQISQIRRGYILRHPEFVLQILRAHTSFVAKPVDELSDIFPMYTELYKDPNLSPLLQVIVSLPALNIIYDPESEDTTRADIATDSGTVGNCYSEDKRIQVAGRRGSKTGVEVGLYSSLRKDVLGTIAHEFCHMVCEMLWKNERNPYAADSVEGKTFLGIGAEIFEEYKDKEKRKKLDPIVQKVFSTGYDERKYARELIVRIPQLIATHGVAYFDSQGSEGVKELFKYYNEEVLVACKAFLVKASAPSPSGGVTSEQDRWACFIDPLPGGNGLIQAASLEEAAAVQLQAIFLGLITRRTFVNLKIVSKSFEVLITQLECLDCQQAKVGLLEDREKQISSVVNKLRDRESLFVTYKESEKLVDLHRPFTGHISTCKF